MALADHLEALDQNDLSDARRAELNARIRAEIARDPSGTRTYLSNLDLTDPWEATAIVEALAGDADQSIALLTWFFDVAVRRATEAPEAAEVLTAYAFLEHGNGKRKFDLLPRYVELARAPQVELRRAAIHLLSGFTAATAPGVRDAFVRLLEDDDWRIRREAEDVLREESLLPQGYRTPLLDRLRRKFSS